MARGWGRSEEDLGAEKEHAREARRAPDRGARRDAERLTQAHSLELSLARIEDQLSKTSNEARRSALESARQELQARLDAVRPPPV